MDAASTRSRRTVVIIGPGKIGCGYLAPLFAQAGWDVVLATRSEEVARRIDAAGRFTVRITGAGHTRQVEARAVVVGSESFESAVAGADLVATAVGTGSVTGLGLPLARALAARPAHRPVDVWAVENANVAPVLEAAVREAAQAHGLGLPAVGFAGAIAWAAVSRGDWKESPRPEFVGDACRVMHVDATQLLTGVPELPGVIATSLYPEHLWAKRMVFSAGHALFAYVGLQRGHRFVDEAARDPRLRRLVRRALLASRAAVLREHPALEGELSVSVDWALERYANADLRDPLTRVGRDPIRKLHRDGPLVGAARLVQRTIGRVPAGFAAGIAGALAHRDGNDAQACFLAEQLEGKTADGVLAAVTGIDPGDPLARDVLRFYRRFAGASRAQEALMFLPLAASATCV